MSLSMYLFSCYLVMFFFIFVYLFANILADFALMYLGIDCCTCVIYFFPYDALLTLFIVVFMLLAHCFFM